MDKANDLLDELASVERFSTMRELALKHGWVAQEIGVHLIGSDACGCALGQPASEAPSAQGAAGLAGGQARAPSTAKPRVQPRIPGCRRQAAGILIAVSRKSLVAKVARSTSPTFSNDAFTSA